MYPGAPRTTLDVTQLADRFHAAHLGALDLVRDQEFLQCDLVPDFVVPDLDLDTPVKGSSLLCGIRGDRNVVTGPLVGNRLRRQRECCLNMLGDLSGTLPRQSRVVTVDFYERIRQGTIVRVPDKVQANVFAVPHPPENAAQRLDRRLRNIGHTGREANRRHEIPELDGFKFISQHFARFNDVADFRAESIRILEPLHERFIDGQMPFDGLSDWQLAGALRGDLCRGHDERRRQCGANNNRAASHRHLVHLPSVSRTSGTSGEAPSRQNTSGSTIRS